MSEHLKTAIAAYEEQFRAACAQTGVEFVHVSRTYSYRGEPSLTKAAEEQNTPLRVPVIAGPTARVGRAIERTISLERIIGPARRFEMVKVHAYLYVDASIHPEEIAGAMEVCDAIVTAAVADQEQDLVDQANARKQGRPAGPSAAPAPAPAPAPAAPAAPVSTAKPAVPAAPAARTVAPALIGPRKPGAPI